MRRTEGGEKMEKDKTSKIIAIIALLIAVVGLSVGFASFSTTLKISSSANVTPNSDTFKVVFSSNGTTLTEGKVTGVASSGATASDATINNALANPTISGLSATFTEPGQNVVYTFYAHNNGEYDAYLKSVTYENVVNEAKTKICTAESGTTEALVATACDAISVKVNVGSTNTTASKANITGHSLLKKAFEEVTVTIEYAADGGRADGDFSVAFGDISLVYSSVD